MPRTEKKAIGRVFNRTCPVCGTQFATDNARTRYDTLECKKKAANERHYQRHADKIRQTNNERQKAQREAAAKLAEFLDSLPPELHDKFLDDIEG